MATTVAVSILSGLSISLLLVTTSFNSEQSTELDEQQALYSAQAAVAVAVGDLTATTVAGTDPIKAVGSVDIPLEVGGGSAWATIEDLGGEVYQITAFGTSSGSRRAIEVTVVPGGQGAFSRALYAGNSSEDPLYTLDLGGLADQADEIIGDVYSGGDLLLDGDASVTGAATASGSILGMAGVEGVKVKTPDLAAMNYEVNHDFNVNDLFSVAVSTSDDAGGTADQVPEDNPAHIFRRNPSDRNSTNNSTTKDDYYLEDPYEKVRKDTAQNGSNPYQISLTGVNGKPGVSGTDAVYFIDGNLWIHNIPTYSFQFVSGKDESVRVTFVVKGNITFSDNLFYENGDEDGIVFIALEDPDVADSGNIYFGDPVGGTLNYMDSFMYAENNFIDTNLDASGSKRVEVNGTMSAGNHVAIERDYGSEHSKLTVRADKRMEDGSLSMPGIPSSLAGQGALVVSTWRLVSYEAAQ